MASCPECREPLPPAGLSCPECGWNRRARQDDGKRSSRAEYLRPRTEDRHCRMHKIPLDPTGWCARAQAWWVPIYRCPECAGPLRDDGYCAHCTPKTRMFPGDYFEQRWEAGPTWGHYVRVHRGPTAAPSDDEVAGYLAELKAIVGTVGRPVGQVPESEPAWVTE
jgi:predicted amidophosphoribosyltransferase